MLSAAFAGVSELEKAEMKQRLEPEQDENYCCECGNPCSRYDYFCDRECRASFFIRYPDDEGMRQLARITKFRQKHGLPYRRDDD